MHSGDLGDLDQCVREESLSADLDVADARARQRVREALTELSLGQPRGDPRHLDPLADRRVDGFARGPLGDLCTSWKRCRIGIVGIVESHLRDRLADLSQRERSQAASRRAIEHAVARPGAALALVIPDGVEALVRCLILTMTDLGDAHWSDTSARRAP